MNTAMTVSSLWLTRMKKNWAVTFVVLIVGLSITALAILQHQAVHAIAYLGAVVVAAFGVDMLTYQTHKAEVWKIKNVRREVILLLSVVALQWIATLGRFVWVADWNTAAIPIKLTLLVMMILFIYPVFLILWYFVIKRYKPAELGLTIQPNIMVAVPIIVLIGITSFLVAPANIQFTEMLNSHSLVQLLLLGFVAAAIPEEFFRLLLQTRLGSFLNHQGWSWLLTGVIWAAIHIPNFGNQSGDWENALISALGILPLGLLWGYLTHRLQNLWPSVLIHGTNLWGLQNIF